MKGATCPLDEVSLKIHGSRDELLARPVFLVQTLRPHQEDGGKQDGQRKKER